MAWGNYERFKAMIYSTLIMIVVALVAYIWAYCKVKNGSGIKDVKLITLLLLISMVTSFIVMTDSLYIVHCPSYYIGFTQTYIDGIAPNVHIVSCFCRLIFSSTAPTPTNTTGLRLECNHSSEQSETRLVLLLAGCFLSNTWLAR